MFDSFTQCIGLRADLLCPGSWAASRPEGCSAVAALLVSVRPISKGANIGARRGEEALQRRLSASIGLGHLGLIEWQDCVFNARSDLRDGDLQIISALQFLPQLRRCAEKAGQAQRHFSVYTAAAMHDFIDRVD